MRNVRVEFEAQMRSSATSPWMPSTETQYEFHMNAKRGGVPIEVLHVVK